jgi:polyketide cyclase/dehydrase/lipid transport protein
MSHAYSFRGTWTLPAPVPRVQEVLLDLERYPEWWPQVRAVAKIGDDDARVLCRSALPYTLDLLLHAERREPTLLETSLAGDLDGVVRWRLADAGPGTRMDFEQDVTVTGRLLRAASYAARPLLHWNHDRMMAGCIAGLRHRLAVQV